MYLKRSHTQRSPVLFVCFFKTTLAEICTDSDASRSSHSTNNANTQLWAHAPSRLGLRLLVTIGRFNNTEGKKVKEVN